MPNHIGYYLLESANNLDAWSEPMPNHIGYYRHDLKLDEKEGSEPMPNHIGYYLVFIIWHKP